MVRKSKGLSERHYKILVLLEEYAAKGYPPSIREIGEQTGITSTSVVNYYLQQLEKWGYIEIDRKAFQGLRFTGKSLPNISLTTSKNLNVKISPKVFISYAHEDIYFAQQLYYFLKQNNTSPWLDCFNLIPGQDWDVRIQQEIESSDYVIICLSSNSVTKRGYIQKEIRKAQSVLEKIPEGDVYIIPIRLDKCEVPTALITRQWLDWNEPNAQKRLLEAFDYPNISSRFNKRSRIADFAEPQDYVADSIEKDKTIDEIISHLIFAYDLKPSQAEKIYNDCYKKLLLNQSN
jgi:biotin operon repressor